MREGRKLVNRGLPCQNLKRLIAVESPPGSVMIAFSLPENWIVTGAQFGWNGGAEALRTLVAVDKRVQELWGIGASSERLAASALAEVERRSK